MEQAGKPRMPATTDRRTPYQKFQSTILNILSQYGRLVYLSSLYDLEDARYHHYDLEFFLGADEADRVIRDAHRQAFHQWLCYDLEQQKADLDLYLSDLGVEKRITLAIWAGLAPYRDLIPPDAEEHERRLFLADLKTLLQLLNRQYGVAQNEPEGWRSWFRRW